MFFSSVYVRIRNKIAVAGWSVRCYSQTVGRDSVQCLVLAYSYALPWPSVVLDNAQQIETRTLDNPSISYYHACLLREINVISVDK